MLDTTVTDPCGPEFLDQAMEKKRGLGNHVAMGRKHDKCQLNFPTAYKFLFLLLPLAVSPCGYYSPDLQGIANEPGRLDASQCQEDALG